MLGRVHWRVDTMSDLRHHSGTRYFRGGRRVLTCRAVTHDYSVDLAQPQPLGSWTEHRRGEHQGDRPGEKSVRGIAEVHLVCVHIDPLGAQSPRQLPTG